MSLLRMQLRGCRNAFTQKIQLDALILGSEVGQSKLNLAYRDLHKNVLTEISEQALTLQCKDAFMLLM